ncbi:MAG: O-antigen ligase family protein [Chthoniobacterales bacterium]
MTTTPFRRLGGFGAASLLAASLVLIQVLIGGRRLIYAFPAYALLVAAAALAFVACARARTKADARCLGATAIFFAYILVRNLLSPAPYFAREDLYSVLAALLVYGIVATQLTSAAQRLTLIVMLLGAALGHVAIGFAQFSRGDNLMLISFLQRVDYGQRASGFYVCPNHLAGLLEVVGIFGVSLTCWSRWPVWAKLLTGYATVVCYVGLALTGSRGGYVSVVASLLVFGASSLFLLRAARPARWLKVGAWGAGGLAAIALVAAALIHQNGFLKQRAGNIIDTKNMRLDLWRAAVTQWQLQPVFGTGSGTYRFYGRQFRTKQVQNDPIDVHNDYLHLLCEYGLLGLAGFALFLFAHLRRGWAGLRRFAGRMASGHGALSGNRLALNLGALGALAAYVVHSAFDFNLHIPANALLLAFVFGILANPGDSNHPAPSGGALARVPQIALAALAAVLLLQSVRLLPAEYYAEHARTALRDEDPTASLLYADQALQSERANPYLHFYRGRAFGALALAEGDDGARTRLLERALASFQEAHRLAPLDGNGVLDLALTFDQMGRFEEADAAYALARQRDPHAEAVAQFYQYHLDQRAAAR